MLMESFVVEFYSQGTSQHIFVVKAEAFGV